MQFIKPDINIDFIGKRRLAYGFSILLVLLTIATLIWHRGPRYGIDFVGGLVIQVKLDRAVELDSIQKTLADVGLSQATVQRFGQASDHEYLVRSDRAENHEDLARQFTERLHQATGATAEIQRVEMVGPQVGHDLQHKALLAIFFSILFMAIYISGRFEQRWMISGLIAVVLIGTVYLLSLFDVGITVLIVVALGVTLILFWVLKLRYAMGATVALIHDVIVTVGFFSLLDKEFSLPIIAALLTIIGYSVNDTIVIFDRIRENLRKNPRQSFAEIVNRSVNETLSRTVLTTGTSLVVVLALTILGGGIIHDFSLALLVGFISGVYSTVYVASPFLLSWQDKASRA
jgi:preprotein translocase subunit SecF